MERILTLLLVFLISLAPAAPGEAGNVHTHAVPHAGVTDAAEHVYGTEPTAQAPAAECSLVGGHCVLPLVTPVRDFVVRNDGIIVHEFNIGTPEMHAHHQEEMQMMVDHGIIEGGEPHREKMKMGMGQGHSMSHDHANSVLLEPGESAEVIWQFGRSMDLEFAGNVPGHYDAGMAGEFRFVDKLANR